MIETSCSRRVAIGISLVLASAGLLGACSDSDGGSDGATDAPEATTTTAAEDTASDEGSGDAATDETGVELSRELTFDELQELWTERLATFPLGAPEDNAFVDVLDGVGEPVPIGDSEFWQATSQTLGSDDPQDVYPGSATVREGAEGEVGPLADLVVIEDADGRILAIVFSTQQPGDPQGYVNAASAAFTNFLWVLSDWDEATFEAEATDYAPGDILEVDGAYLRLTTTPLAATGLVAFAPPAGG